jgi:DNA-binding transcriptional regulator YdaS (Cro superfamily)
MKRSDLELLGGASEVAKLCGVKPSAVSMWFTPKEKNGLGGKIPYKHAKKILEKTVSMGKPWTLDYIIGE